MQRHKRKTTTHPPIIHWWTQGSGVALSCGWISPPHSVEKILDRLCFYLLAEFLEFSA